MRATMFVPIAAVVFSSAILEARAQPPDEAGNPGKEQRFPDPLRKVVVTSPLVKDVVVTQHFSSQIRARRHIEVRALSAGYIESVSVREGQAVKKGDVLFKIDPALYKARLDAELAEVQFAQLELANTKKLFDKKMASEDEVKLFEAKLAKAQTKAKVAQVELDFTTFKAPFDGLLGRIATEKGSLVKEGDTLTTLSDNSVMWVYFHVSEARYLELMARKGKSQDPSRLELADSRIELMLADESTFAHDAGNVVTIEGKFNNETGSISLRAEFPNPDCLLRHGQTGTVLIRRTVKNATVIPQQATFEVIDRRYVYVVGKDGVAHQREIAVQHEVDDVFVIKNGLDVSDRIVLEGIRGVRDGEKVESEFRKPEEAIDGLRKGREK